MQLLPKGTTFRLSVNDYMFTIDFENNEGRSILQIESSLILTAPNGVRKEFKPSSHLTADKILPESMPETVESVETLQDGRLGIVIIGGWQLQVSGSDELEAWNFVKYDGLRIVSMPGKEIATWPSAS